MNVRIHADTGQVKQRNIHMQVSICQLHRIDGTAAEDTILRQSDIANVRRVGRLRNGLHGTTKSQHHHAYYSKQPLRVHFLLRSF